MSMLRSVLFAVVLVITTPPFALIALCIGPLAPMTRYRIITKWTDIVLWFVWHLLGIRFRVIGKENLPNRASVILCKHQSAWETMALQHVFPAICFVLKKELLRVPFFGWGLARMPMIAIDRAAGKDALAQVLEQGSRRLAEGFWVVVFPEGTRVAPGTTRRYKPGGAWLAHKTEVPVVPVAHNAGEFWRRNAFMKYPGEIIVSIGPSIDGALYTADEINTQARNWIEAEMRRLFPHHYRGSSAVVEDTAAAGDEEDA
ncbi:MAG: 1-acyl-sn-glycerol-3-phosphate acyltransferase [Zoogloeaceae bacterium]|nr:1-acyl-sn-glycerol-3-phosphate acyltransferase [Zoogloeaceae bacterium]